MRVLLATGDSAHLEPKGAQLASTMSAVLRSEFCVPDVERPPEGPYFRYEAARGVFLGRQGTGPLIAAWDTNLLIDYFEHGEQLWNAAPLATTIPGLRGEQLEALQLIVSLWVVRDIRFRLLDRVLNDARSELCERRRRHRRVALEEFARALSLVDGFDDVEAGSRGLLTLPASVLERALSTVPAGADRDLVAAAHAEGVHVFLTRDRGILRCAGAFRPLGLLIADPATVLELLAECGAMHCLLDRRCLYWPAPDMQRVAHLIQALPSTYGETP